MNKRWYVVPFALTVTGPALAAATSQPEAVTRASTAAAVATAAPADVSVPQWQALYNQTSQTTPFRIPADMAVAPPLAPGQLVSAKYAPFTGTVTLAKNNAYGILSTLLTNATSVQALGAAFTPVANTTPLYPQYENDGYAINSCDEFVYKKYYDYRRFQDAAATCGGSPDCVYNLWATASVPGEALNMLPKSGIAWTMSPYPTSTLDPSPFVQGQSGSTQQLKNPFRDPANLTQFNLALQYAMSGASASELASLSTVATYLESAAFTSSSPYYTIQGSRMPWHVQMHNQQATYGETMTDRANVERRVSAMQAAVGAFEAGYAADSAAYEAWSAEVIRLCGGIATPIPRPCTPTNPCGKPPPPPSQACLNARAHEPGMTNSIATGTVLGNLLLAELDNVDRVTGQVDSGCLGTTHNKCDWSPTMIAQEYMTTLDAQVASDLASCDSFFGTSAVSSLNETLANATSDEAVFSLALADAQGQAMLDRTSLSWTTAAPNTIRYDLFGGPQSWSIGGSFAGADYSQQAYWEVKGEKNGSNLCRLSGRIYGAANADATVFGIKATLLDADVQVGIGETVAEAGVATDVNGGSYESHLTIAGDSLYAVSGGSATGAFGGPIGNYNYTDTVLDVPGQISWLSLDLKVNVIANVNVSLAGTPPPPCSSVTDITQLKYSLGVNVTPSVGAAAIGTALVGALGTGVGVQGTVDVLTVSLPINLTTDVGVGTDGNLDMILNANASLALNVLSGEIDAAECVLGDCATQELYRWNGIPAFNDVLWSTTDQYPLITMQNVFNQ